MKKIDSNTGKEVIICDICSKIISFPYEHNAFKKLPEHFLDVCKDHAQYATVFLADIVAENLGFKDVEKNRVCEFCNKPVTNEEVQKCLENNAFHILCEKHLDEYGKLFMLPENKEDFKSFLRNNTSDV